MKLPSKRAHLKSRSKGKLSPFFEVEVSEATEKFKLFHFHLFKPPSAPA